MEKYRKPEVQDTDKAVNTSLKGNSAEGNPVSLKLEGKYADPMRDHTDAK